MCSNPEFLKEGAAVDDFLKPDRVVLGAESDHARSVMAELYAPFVRTGKPIIFMDIPSAEMTKYAANAMLATRISFMNEIALLCESVDHHVTSFTRHYLIVPDDELPLFALAPKPAPRKDELREKLAEIDPDELSPRDAQAALYALKKLATEK